MIADAVIHAYNFSEDNLIYEPYSRRFGGGTYAHHKMWSPPDSDYILTEDEFVRDFDEEDTADAVFGESPVDVAVFHSTPIYDFFRDGLVSVEKGARLKERYPGRVLHYGAVPLLDKHAAIERVDELIGSYGVDGLKFYPAVYVDGRTVHTSLADETVAFPVIERAAERGIRNVAVHKSLPLGPTTSPPYRVDDVAAAAAAFPDVNFQIVHAGVAFTEETALLLGRFGNVYANLEGTFGYIARKPRTFYESIGLMAEWSGYDRLLFASGCNVAHPRPLIDLFLGTEMPRDLVEEHGFPELDEVAKAAILGGNLARLHGLDDGDVVTDDHFAPLRTQERRPWSRLRERSGELQHAG